MKIIICDHTYNSKYFNEEDLIILWDKYNINDIKNYVSLPKYIEKNSKKLRELYLNWISEISERRSLKEIFKLEKDFSLWSLSLIEEKDTFEKSKQIYDVIKCFAILEIIHNYKYEKLIIKTNKKKINSTLRNFCEARKIKFEDSILRINLQKIYETKLIFYLKGILWIIRYIINNRKILGKGSNLIFKDKRAITIINYAINIEKSKLLENQFKSYYWGKLPEILKKNKNKINWLHIYIKSDTFKNIEIANTKFKKLNQNSSSDLHQLVDSFASLKLIIKTFFKWNEIIFKNLFFNQNKDLFLYKDFNFSHLMSADFNNSFFGHHGLKNILYFYIFKKISKKFTKQHLLIYLYENIAWEKSLLHNWKKYQSKNVIAYAHSTIRFWDLRYFHSINHKFKTISGNLIPNPICVNGPLAKSNLKESYFKHNKIIELEALRYKYLLNYKHKKQTISRNFLKSRQLKILVIGDINRSYNMYILDQISFVVRNSPSTKFKIICKPHPFTKINKENYKHLNLEISNNLIPNLAQNCDFAIISSFSGALLDLLCLEVPTFVAIKVDRFNMSPIKNESGFKYIFSKEDFLKKLGQPLTFSNKNSNPKNYFCLNQDLENWIEQVNKKKYD